MRRSAPVSPTRIHRYSRAGLLALVLAEAAIGFAQVIENPAKPRAANTGRVVTPQQVVSISDEGTSDFYFKSWLHNLRTSPDGSLILREENQILLFDKNGKFRHNFFKKGQGPGELTFFGICWPTDKNVIVQSSYPNKLIFFDYSGKFEHEVRIGPVPGTKRPQSQLLLVHGEAYFFEAWDSPPFRGEDPQYVDIPRMILALDSATGELKTLTTFSTTAYVLAAPGGGGAYHGITSLIAVPFKEKYLALTHTDEYLLKLYDPAANRIVKEFKRSYGRIKPEPLTDEQKRGGPMIGGKPFRPPELKFQNDIKNILTRDGEIWVVTSTKDKAKGILIDVFDGEGIYRDAFWLKLPEPGQKSLYAPGRCVLDGEFLWVVERDEDEVFSIKKYRVVI
jgi:hypothetical protein